MRELSRLTKETIHSGASDQDGCVYIHQIDSLYNLRVCSPIGQRNPLYSTAVGKGLLAGCYPEEVKERLAHVGFMPRTERIITDIDN